MFSFTVNSEAHIGMRRAVLYAKLSYGSEASQSGLFLLAFIRLFGGVRAAPAEVATHHE